MYKSEIKDLQDTMKKWQRFRVTCEHRNNAICRHNLTNGVMCGIGICPGGFDEEPTGTKYDSLTAPIVG